MPLFLAREYFRIKMKVTQMVAVNFENIFVNRFVDEFFRMLDLEMKREDKNDWMFDDEGG